MKSVGFTTADYDHHRNNPVIWARHFPAENASVSDWLTFSCIIPVVVWLCHIFHFFTCKTISKEEQGEIVLKRG